MASGADPELDLSRTDLAAILREVYEGRAGARDRLAEAVFTDLRSMARHRLEKDFGSHLAGITIQPTVLATDTLLKLLQQRSRFDSAGHFFAIASRKMWELLMDYHRQRKVRRPRDGAVLVSLDAENHDVSAPGRAFDVDAIIEVLEKLGARDPRKREVFEYRVLWRFSIDQTAEALGLSHATVERDLSFALAWVTKELRAR